jgi:hypothetical protein
MSVQNGYCVVESGDAYIGGYQTVFGSLDHYEKGGVQVIDADPKHYGFSNCFEAASRSKPYEKVAVGKNLKYVIEAIRAEGTSPWYSKAHDEPCW